MDDCLAEEQASSLNWIEMQGVVVSREHHESLLVFGFENPLMGCHPAERNLEVVMHGREPSADLMISRQSAISPPRRENSRPERCFAYR